MVWCLYDWLSGGVAAPSVSVVSSLTLSSSPQERRSAQEVPPKAASAQMSPQERRSAQEVPPEAASAHI